MVAQIPYSWIWLNFSIRYNLYASFTRMSSWMTVMVIYGMFVVPSDLILNSELRYCQAHMQMYTMSWMQLSVKPLKSCGSSYKVTQYVVLILVKESRKDIIFMFEMEHPCRLSMRLSFSFENYLKIRFLHHSPVLSVENWAMESVFNINMRWIDGLNSIFIGLSIS